MIISAPARRMDSRGLHHDLLPVDPAPLGRGLDHGVLPGDVVGGQGLVEIVGHGPDHVQVGQGRLDHDDVGPLLHIQGHLAQGLPDIGRVHLVGLAVPEGGGGLGRLPEGAVKGRGVLGRVGHDHRILEPGLVQPGPDGLHPAVHHVRGGHHVGSGLGLGHGGSG